MPMPKKKSAKRQPKPYQETISKASTSAYETKKAYQLQVLREALGWSWFELSYMLGKDNGSYVRDVENPLHTLKYDPADVNYIALILLKNFSEILPPPVNAKNFNLSIVSYPDDTRRTVYEISVLSEAEKYILFHKFTQERRDDILPTPLKTFEATEVEAYITTLLKDDFFNSPKTALDVLTACRKHFGEDFHPRYMIQTLIEFCDGRKGKKLDDNRKNDGGRRVFFKPYTFNIESDAQLSKSLLEKGIDNFIDAAVFVKELPYRRNKDKNNPRVVLEENCGTCSTKHALLKRIADENGHPELKLVLGIYKMDARNTPRIAPILEKYKLKYIPEAHNYLRVHGYILDFTGLGMSEAKLASNLLTEIEITPDQITDYKIDFHKEYLSNWLADEKVNYSLAEIWRIREECIEALTARG